MKSNVEREPHFGMWFKVARHVAAFHVEDIILSFDYVSTSPMGTMVIVYHGDERVYEEFFRTQLAFSEEFVNVVFAGVVA